MDSPNSDDLELIERQLTNLPLPSAPASLRSAVLTDVHRNLKAQRWDRRMGRTAASLLVVGIGMNAMIGWRNALPAPNQTVAEFMPSAITQVAVVMADVNGIEMACQITRHVAALRGTALSQQQEAAIQSLIESHSRHGAAQRKDG